MFGSWVLNKIWIIDLASALIGQFVNEFIQIISFFLNNAHLNPGMRLLLELYMYFAIVIKHVAFFSICAKLTMAVTFTSLPLKFYTFGSECVYGFGFEEKHWRIDGFSEKKAFVLYEFYEWCNLQLIIHMKKNYSILIGWEQCSSSVIPVQITHRNSGLWFASRQWEIFEADDIK